MDIFPIWPRNGPVCPRNRVRRAAATFSHDRPADYVSPPDEEQVGRPENDIEDEGGWGGTESPDGGNAPPVAIPPANWTGGGPRRLPNRKLRGDGEARLRRGR